MHEAISLEEKYERNGWPSLDRPDRKPPAGWSLSLITGVDRVRNHALSPDGARIAFIWDRADLSDVYIMDAGNGHAGGWPGRVSTRRALSAYWSDEEPRWSPDGTWLAFTMDDHVHVAPVSGGEPRKISDFATEASAPVWMPDSSRLIVSVERDDRTQLVLTDRDGAWPRGLVTAPGGDAWDAQPAPDGCTVAFVWRPFDDLNRHDICVVDVASGAVRHLTGTAKQRDWSPRWSPDGGTLAFLSERSGFDEVWLMDGNGEHLRRLTRLEHDVTDIAWSPDGTRLACVVNRGGAFELSLVDARDGACRTLRGGRGFHSRPCWTPDGTALTVEYEDPVTPPDLYRVEVDSGRTDQLTFSNPPALAANALVTPELVSYRAQDGLEIPAFLYRPAQPNGAAVMYPHGGPSSQYVFEWDIWAQYLVAKGYTVLAPNYRGSTGYGRAFAEANHFDWGKGDLQDCLDAARFLHTLDWIDPARLASAGGSYGGYLTAGVLSRDPDYLYACGVAEYGDMELIASWAQCNRDLRLYVESFLGHPADRRGVYWDGSTIFQVE